MLPKSIGLLLSGGFFVVVHNVFPINYQWVLKVFPKMFSIVLSHTFCPKLNFHIYTYIYYKGGQRKQLYASILGSAQCLKKLWWVNQSGLAKVELSYMYIYILQRGPKEATLCFYFGECPMLKKIVMGQSKWLLQIWK